MADPLSLAASIVTVAQLAWSVLEYICGVKDASQDCKQLVVEISCIRGILDTLKKTVKEEEACGEAWSATIRLLNDPGGPLQQLKQALEELKFQLQMSIATTTGFKKVVKTLRWPLNEGEIRKLLTTIERLKSLLALALHNDHVALSKAILDSARAIQHQVAELRKDVEICNSGIADLHRRQQDDYTKRILTWLSPLNFWDKYKDVISSRRQETGGWFLSHPNVLKWLNGTQKELFCPGIPGAGKTVLASVVIEHLHSRFPDNSIGLAWIFCSYNEKHPPSTADLLGALLQQLLDRRCHNWEAVAELYKRYQHKTRPDLTEYAEILRSETSRFDKVYIVIDAVDELSHDIQIIQDFITATSRLGANVKLLVTSRFNAGVEDLFRDAARVEIRASDDDIKRYVEFRCQAERRLRSNLEGSPKLACELTDTIINKCQGMFLLAKLHMDSLSKKLNRRALREGLQQLSNNLDATYEVVMQRVNKQEEDHVELAKRVLSWVCFAREPLSIKFLQYVIAIKHGDCKVDEDGCVSEKDLVLVCAGFITVDCHSQKVHLVHYTAKGYFERHGSNHLPGAHEELAKVCLTFILSSTFLALETTFDPCVRSSNITTSSDYLFAEYAVEHVGDHFRNAAKSGTLKMLESLFSDDKRLALFWKIRDRASSVPQRLQWATSMGDKLRFAASAGLVEIVEWLLTCGASPDQRDSLGRTALCAAAEWGEDETIRTLLREGAAIDLTSRYSDRQALYAPLRTPLDCAILNGHTSTVELLVGEGAKLRVESGADLCVAARLNRTDILQLLIQRGARIDAQCGVYGSALIAAAGSSARVQPSALDAMQFLLDTGARVEINVGDHGTPLIAAAGSTSDKALERVQVLLERGANVNAQGGVSHTALIAAARSTNNCSIKLLQLLLSHGADINLYGGRYGNALIAAVKSGLELATKKVEILLQKGADINASGPQGSALITAAVAHNPRIVEFLLSRNIDVSNGILEDAITSAAAAGCTETLQLLLAHEANTTAERDHVGRHCTALMAAAKSNWRPTRKIEILLSNGVSIHSQSQMYGSALQAALDVDTPDIEVIRFLLNKGVEVNAPGRGTAIEIATTHLTIAEAKHAAAWEETVKFILQRGALPTHTCLEELRSYSWSTEPPLELADFDKGPVMVALKKSGSTKNLFQKAGVEHAGRGLTEDTGETGLGDLLLALATR